MPTQSCVTAARVCTLALVIAAAFPLRGAFAADPLTPQPSPSPSATPGEIGRVRAPSGFPANQTITSSSSVDINAAAQTRGTATIENYAYDTPGVVYFHSGKSNLDHFKIRGADNEPRTELDGHPLSNTGAGNVLVGWLNAFAFDRIDIEKGPGIAEGDEGRSAFGTIDLITRGFSATPTFDSVLGFDSQWGSTVALTARGPLDKRGRLQYVLSDNYAGMPDPTHQLNGLFFGPARTNLVNGTAIAAYSGSLADGLGLRNEIAKVRYAFSPATSFEAGFIGFQGLAAPLGGAYAGYEGDFITGASPAAASLAGTVQPFYSGYTNGSERVNEPFFESVFRTQIGTDTLSVSPFTGIVSDLLAYAPPPAAVANVPNSKFTGDRLHGTTFTYLHPFANGYIKLNYEYRSDTTTVYTGTTFTPATLTTPPTTLHENDISLTSSLDLTSRLKLGLGIFSDAYHNDIAVQNQAALAAGTPTAQVPFSGSVVRSNHLDPHIGFVFHAAETTWLRAAFGSSVYGPGSTLVSGRSTYAAPAASNNNQGLITTVNPNLQPEVTVAYGLGIDRRFHDGTLLSVDAYDDTIHNKFLAFTATGSPVTIGGITSTPLVNQTINASLQRTYGVEVGLHRSREHGFGYDVAMSLDRQYFDQIPPAYFLFAGGPVSPFNGYQGTTYPYFTAHEEFRYAWPRIAFALGSDTAGADNVQRAPGFTTLYASVQMPVGYGNALQFTVDNLMNDQTSALNFGTGPTGSGASTITAFPAGGVLNAPLVYGQTLANVQGVPPRVFRFSLITHLGR
jgi:hypothetical protein